MLNKRIKSLLAVVAAVLMMVFAPDAKGQTPPQVFSPDAAELGKYGRTPVSYFTGVPSITVPLTSLKARGYELPVYLSYHASGNRPESHPGWVGLGWSLHAGGSITRVINGQKDDYSNLELIDFGGSNYYGNSDSGPGYSYHMDDTQRCQDWTDSTTLFHLTGVMQYGIVDHQPDEFIVNIDGIRASFFMVGENDVKIVSKDDVDFEVSWDYGVDSEGTGILVNRGKTENNWDFRARRYKYFKWFTITDREGNRYHFGDIDGEDNSIEYSVVNMAPVYTSVGVKPVRKEWKAVATANTWLLKKIERTDGEVITFEYERDGCPVVRTEGIYGWNFNIPDKPNYLPHDFSTFDDPDVFAGVSMHILCPSYLSRMASSLSGDELHFHRSESVERGYHFVRDEFNLKIGRYYYPSYPMTLYEMEDWPDMRHYCQLDSITGVNRRIALHHSSDTTARLTLTEVSFLDEDHGSDHKYVFSYNGTKLPGYNSMEIDLWGYYNGKCYRNEIAGSGKDPDAFRTPDENLMKAEILESITYPTGGHSFFEFEPHRYSRVAMQFPFELDTLDSDMMAGGLRIRRIIDIPAGGECETREFIYEDESGHSSGILSGHVTNKVSGRQYLKRLLKTRWLSNPFYSSTMAAGEYVIYSDSPILPLSETDGSHVTYSRVVEVFSDRSSIIRRYTNHDYPGCMDCLPDTTFENIGNDRLSTEFGSRALFRGLLTHREDVDAGGTVRRREENAYRFSTDEYFKSAGSFVYCDMELQSAWYIKKLFSFPALTHTTITEYADDGTSVSSTTTYQYNSERRLVSESTWSGGMTSGRMVFYPSDRTGETYACMLAAGMSGVPVGEATLRDGKIVSAREMTYRPVPLTVGDTTVTRYLPDRIYTSSFSSPLEPSAYNASPMSYMASVPQMEFLRYDASGNPVEVIADGISSEYGWDGQSNPSFISSGMRNAVTTVGDVYQREDIALNYRTSTQTIRREFTTTGPSRNVWVSVSMQQGYGWLFYVAMDGVEVGRIVTYGSYWEPTGQWLGYLESYEGSVSVNVPAGDHVISITRLDSWKETSYPDAGAGTLMIHYYSSQTLQTGTDDVAFMFDFEEDASSAEGGFFSGKAHVGLFRPGVTVPSDRMYLVDYRVYDGGEWKFTQSQYTGPTMSVGTSGKRIDHVRIFPADAGITSYTWSSGPDLMSETDSRGVTTSYEYDLLGRLRKVMDNDGETVAGYSYHYSTRSDVSDTLNTVSENAYLSPGEASARTSVTVFDGLGRAVRNILRNGGGSGWDIVTRSDYDLNGRPWHSWLPVAVNGDGAHSDTGSLDEGAASLYGLGEVACSENEYEPSPLDRVRTEIGPGAAWRNPVRGVSHATFTNAVDTASPFFYRGYAVNWDFGRIELVRNSPPSPDTMLIQSTTDEDGRVTLEFINPIGETVLVRQMADSTGAVKFDTHYVYDSMGRLSVVIPPSLSEIMLSSGRSYWYESDLSDLAYLYRYDSRGNCIAKLIPGGGWYYYVYDRNNRPVLSQDAVQRQSDEWSFSISDRQERPVLSGVTQMSLNAFSDPLRNADVHAVLPLSPSYDNPFMGYVLNGVNIQTPNVFSVNYYDGRGFAGAGPFPSAITVPDMPGNRSSAAYTKSDCGMLTGSLTRTLGEDGVQYLYSIPYYDARGQVVKSMSSTHLGGKVREWNKYDFEGKLTGTRLWHNPASGTAFTQDYAYTYDAMGRPLTATLKVSGQSAPSVLYSNSYDIIGRLTSDGRGTSYAYNVRSWLTSITGQGFTEDLYYWDGLTPQYGGSISSMSWEAVDEDILRRYDYSYDGLSRLTQARYSEDGVTTQNKRFFEEEYGYDPNGNMERLVRYGLSSNLRYRSTKLNLAMEYSGNQLATVRKSSGTESSFGYDVKGRQTSSTYGGTSSMTYNAIDLPARFVKGGTSVRWMYGTDGTKLQVRTAKAQ